MQNLEVSLSNLPENNLNTLYKAIVITAVNHLRTLNISAKIALYISTTELTESITKNLTPLTIASPVANYVMFQRVNARLKNILAIVKT